MRGDHFCGEGSHGQLTLWIALTVETWVLWNLTGGLNGGLFLTDCTNASRTMFMSLKDLDWDAECLKFFGVKHTCLPKIVSNSEVYGKVSSGAFEGFPIAGMIGDQQAALVGNKVSKHFCDYL